MTTVNASHVAILLPSMNGGGIQRVMLNLAVGFQARGKRVDLLLVHASGILLQQVPEQIRIVDLNGRRTIGSLPGLVRYLRENRPDTVVSALECVNLLNVWARILGGVRYRCVLTTHTTVSQDFRKLPRSKRLAGILGMRLCYGFADHVLVVSAAVGRDLAQLTGRPEEFFQLAYNPVVTPALYMAAEDAPDHPWCTEREPPLIVALGRLCPEKDFATLIRAFALVERHRDCRLLILGEGPLRQELTALIGSLGLEGKIDLAGFKENPYAVLARSRLFVLSSRYEGLPTALIEALALGIPVVATDCQSGPAEILQQGRYGQLVPVGDAPALAAAILTGLAEQGAAVPEQAWAPFAIDQAVDRYLAFVQ